MSHTYWTEFLTIVVAHALAVASPGPDFALVLRQSLAYGRRTALWSSIGIGCAAVRDDIAANLAEYQAFWDFGYGNPPFDADAICPF